MNKTTILLKAALALLPVLCVLPSSCERLQDETDRVCGEIRISFLRENPFHAGSKAGIPDTNNFILSVCDGAGRQLYKGKYGDAPDRLVADPGSYSVSAVSAEFDEPRFDSPQYGDNQLVTVRAGQTVDVLLDCVQQNSGIRLNVSADFRKAYPGGSLFLKSSSGTLMYGYSEKRVAYFKPGVVNLSLSDGGVEQVLFSRALESQQVLVVNVSSGRTGESGAGIELQVDTTRNWVAENYVFGGESGQGDGYENAMSVTEARNAAGKTEVWVYGYIVGGDLTSSKCSFDGPFSSRTNLVLAAKSSCRDKSVCLSVQLSAGDVREALNLVDHPSNVGRQVLLKGDIVPSYYGIPGVQGVSEFRWK